MKTKFTKKDGEKAFNSTKKQSLNGSAFLFEKNEKIIVN